MEVLRVFNLGLKEVSQTPCLITPPLNRDYNRNPDIKALKRRGFINHGSTIHPWKAIWKFQGAYHTDNGSRSQTLNPKPYHPFNLLHPPLFRGGSS